MDRLNGFLLEGMPCLVTQELKGTQCPRSQGLSPEKLKTPAHLSRQRGQASVILCPGRLGAEVYRKQAMTWGWELGG